MLCRHRPRLGTLLEQHRLCAPQCQTRRPEQQARARTLRRVDQTATAEQLVKSDFPKAKSSSFPDQNSAFLQVATGRANGIVVENYLLAQFNKSNGNKLQEVPFPKPLQVQYGAYGVQKGNVALVKALNGAICKVQASGELAKIYQKTEGTKLPPMPGC